MQTTINWHSPENKLPVDVDEVFIAEIVEEVLLAVHTVKLGEDGFFLDGLYYEWEHTEDIYWAHPPEDIS